MSTLVFILILIGYLLCMLGFFFPTGNKSPRKSRRDRRLEIEWLKQREHEKLKKLAKEYDLPWPETWEEVLADAYKLIESHMDQVLTDMGPPPGWVDALDPENEIQEIIDEIIQAKDLRPSIDVNRRFRIESRGVSSFGRHTKPIGDGPHVPEQCDYCGELHDECN